MGFSGCEGQKEIGTWWAKDSPSPLPPSPPPPIFSLVPAMNWVQWDGNEGGNEINNP